MTARREGEMGVSMVGREKRCGENPGDVLEEVVLGVDTHLEVHVAVALDGLGRRLRESWPCRRPRRATRALSPGRKASAG